MANSQIRAAEELIEQGFEVVRNVAVSFANHPSSTGFRGIADYIAYKDGLVLIGEVKDGMGAKLSKFQRALITSESALLRIMIDSGTGNAAPFLKAAGLQAGQALAHQGISRIGFTLTGELSGRAAVSWGMRSGIGLASRILSLPAALLLHTQ